MPDFRSRIKTTHVMWIKRYFTTEESVWKNTFDNLVLTPFGTDLLLHCNYDFKFLKEPLSAFYYHVLQSWEEYQDPGTNVRQLRTKQTNIWNNTSIRINNSPIFYKKLAGLGCHKDVLKTFDYWVKKRGILSKWIPNMARFLKNGKSLLKQLMTSQITG